MDDQLLHYYERELSYIRQMGAEFAAKYPKIAGRLLLEPETSTDPHTERLIEAFAFISGRIHKKIDDDFPEITESLFNIIYPHYNKPIPPMTIIRFHPILKNVSEKGFTIDRNTKLYSRPVNNNPCQFRTCMPVTLWPVTVEAAEIEEPKSLIKDAVQVLHLKLKTANDILFSKLNLENLRFFLHGQGQHVFHLYERLLNNVCHMAYTLTNGKSFPVNNLKWAPVGFEENEGMLPFSKRSFPGYRLLFEYFCFAEKFLFLDLKGLDSLKNQNHGDTLDLWIYLNKKAKTNLVINQETFCLNAAPAVNLFSKTAEPLRVEQHKTEYRVIPDIRRQDATEIYSVDTISATSDVPGEQIEYRPFYSMRHHLNETDTGERQVFWHIQRRASERREDHGTEIFLSFSDLSFNPKKPAADILTARLTCTNRDLASRLPIGKDKNDFRMETAAPVQGISGMMKPSPTRRPFMGSGLQWRLISHLSLNYISLVNEGEEALKEILMLYDFDNAPVTQQQINGIVAVESRHVTRRIRQSFCRGVKVTITFDEGKYVGTGLYLFSSILERFLAQYVSVNSFSQLEVKTLQKKGILKLWPPRSGNRILL